MTRRLALSIAIVVMAGCSYATPVVDGPGLTGRYVVNGFDPLGFEYSGIVEISTIGDTDQLLFQWLITGAQLEGTGTLDGNTIEVTWEAINPPGGGTGTATYTVADDGSMSGIRTIDGVDSEGTEDIFPEP